jgi:hypothetical protein
MILWHPNNFESFYGICLKQKDTEYFSICKSFCGFSFQQNLRFVDPKLT